jgi:hypothetical protein
MATSEDPAAHRLPVKYRTCQEVLLPEKLDYAKRRYVYRFSESYEVTRRDITRKLIRHTPLARPASGLRMFSDDERREYAAKQYDSIRAACNQAREAHHSILTWSQAVSGTLFAAGLVAAASHSDRFTMAAQFVFGLVIPAIIIGSALAWAGEMIRMETIGLFLRAFERAVWNRDDGAGKIETSWFVWENFIWSPPRVLRSYRFGKQATAYAGVAVFYAMLYGGSLIVFWVISPWWLALIDSILAITLGIIVMIPPAIQVLRLGSTAPTITDADLTGWARELLDDKTMDGRPTPFGYLKDIIKFKTDVT